MSIYQKLSKIAPNYVSKHKLFKWGFNISPMYRMSTARITTVSDDLKQVRIKLPINYKNRNYAGSIFGGSLFASVDPIPMVQLLYILDNQYIVWDKSAEIFFKIPARENLYAEFTYTDEEVESIKHQVHEHGEFEFVKTNHLTNKTGDRIFCVVKKKIYIATKEHFKKKSQLRKRVSV